MIPEGCQEAPNALDDPLVSFLSRKRVDSRGLIDLERAAALWDLGALQATVHMPKLAKCEERKSSCIRALRIGQMWWLSLDFDFGLSWSANI